MERHICVCYNKVNRLGDGEKMRRLFCLLCAIAVLASGICTGCSSLNSGNPEASTVETEATNKGDAVHHEFKTFVYSDFYREIYDEATEETFRAYCEAVSKGETEFVCTSDDFMITTRLKMLASEYMPLAYTYAKITAIDADNVAHIDYDLSADEFLAKLEAFKNKVIQILDETCKAGYSDAENAIAIYDYFAKNFTYTTYTSSYVVIMEGNGVCQDFASAYDYLLGQVGIDAGVCNSMLNKQVPHTWSLIRIDGEYYHADPTYALSNPGTIRYFGFTDEMRAGLDNYEEFPFTYGFGLYEDNDGKFKSEDDRFVELSDTSDYELDLDNGQIKYVSAATGEDKVFVVTPET